jgi:peptide/nickel transport system ATP-binding protein/oligopeptide transport system ATP-binding protein
LDIRNLVVHYCLPQGIVKAVDEVSLQINQGEVVGLAGESGCGKSTLGLSIPRLLPSPQSVVPAGEILFKGVNISEAGEPQLRALRGKNISVIFQDPTSSLNPVLTVDFQLSEAVSSHENRKREDVQKRTLELLEKVGMPDPNRALKAFPHELSGGQRQRVMIAMAVACNPELLIADEPTTNLDVTVEAQILRILKELRKESGSSILFISHNLGIIAGLADKVAIMYAGDIVEFSDVISIFKSPQHPYTSLLLKCLPRRDRKQDRLEAIPGRVPSLMDPPSGCKFHPRCPYSKEICRNERPESVEVRKRHFVACTLYK